MSCPLNKEGKSIYFISIEANATKFCDSNILLLLLRNFNLLKEY